MTISTWSIIDEIRLSWLKPQPAALEVYRRLRRYGKLLKVPVEGGVTPYEFAAAFGARIPEITRQGFAAGAGSIAINEILSIMRKIVRLSYRPSNTEATPVSGIIEQWKSLRWRLRLMWIVRVIAPVHRLIVEGFAGHTEKQQASVE